MGNALSNTSNKVSHKGSGYKSATNKTPLKSASRDGNSGRRTQQLKSKYHSMEDIIRSANNDEDFGSRASTRDVRPPSRHLTPPKAVGLELPPKPMTPPESENLFDKTWSHSARLPRAGARELAAQLKTRESSRKGGRSSSQTSKRMKGNTRPSSNDSAIVSSQEKQRSRTRSKQSPSRKMDLPTDFEPIVSKPIPLSSKITPNPFQPLIPIRESNEKRLRGAVKGIGFP